CPCSGEQNDMARPKGDGIKVVRKRRPDGSIVEYRYARRQDAAKPVSAPPTGTIAALITKYLGSSDFRKLKPGTKELYRRYLDQIREGWGGIAIRAVRPGDIQRLKDEHQDSPSKANMLLAVLSILFKFAMRRDYCAGNPAANPGRLEPAKREHLWTPDEEARVLAAFRPSLRLAYMLLAYTVQRPSDVLAMTKGMVYERDGRLWIELRQQKTGELVAVPVHEDLAPLIRARLSDMAGGLLLVPSPTGKPWSRRNFSRAWDHDLARANSLEVVRLRELGWAAEAISKEMAGRHRQRRDLRRTGIVRLAQAGATTPQIAAVSGHRID